MGGGEDEGDTAVLTVLVFFAVFLPPIGSVGHAFGHDGQKWLLLSYLGMLAGKRLDLRWVPWLVWCVVSALLAYDWWQGFFGQWGMYNSAVLQCLLLWVMYGAGWGGGSRALAYAFRLAVVLSGFYAMSQFFTGVVPGSSVVAGFTGRAYGGMGSPVYLGSMLAVMGPVVLPVGGWLFAGFFGAVMLATGARGAFLALAVGMVYLGWLRWPKRRGLIVGVALAGFVAAVLAVWGRPGRGASDSGRFLIYKTCAAAAVSAMPFGWGPENTMYGIEVFKDRLDWSGVYGPNSLGILLTEGHAHNAVLDSWVATGAGVVPFLLVVWCVWKSARPGRPRAVLLALAVSSMVNPVPLSVKAVALMYVGMRSRPGRFVVDAPRWSFLIAALSLAGAVYCARLSMVAFDEGMPAALREHAAVAVRMLHLTN